MKISVIFFLFTSSILAHAEDWSVKGRDYHNVKVTQIDADKVHVTYDGGLGSILLSDLPPDLQKRFNYDPQTAKSSQQAEAEREAASDKERALESQKQAADAAAEAQKRAAQDNQDRQDSALKASARQVPFRVIQVLGDGVLATTVGVAGVTLDGETEEAGGGKSVFIEMDSSGLVDNQQITVLAAPSGTYSYTDTLGATRTVQKWIAVSKN